MDRLKIARRGLGGRGPGPAGSWPTRPTPARRSALTCDDAASRPPSPNPPTRSATGSAAAAGAAGRPRSTPALQAAQHRRARLQPAPPAPRRRHPVRQARLRLPRNRRRRRDPDLAPRPRPMIYGTRPNGALGAPRQMVKTLAAHWSSSREPNSRRRHASAASAARTLWVKEAGTRDQGSERRRTRPRPRSPGTEAQQPEGMARPPQPQPDGTCAAASQAQTRNGPRALLSLFFAVSGCTATPHTVTAGAAASDPRVQRARMQSCPLPLVLRARC